MLEELKEKLPPDYITAQRISTFLGKAARKFFEGRSNNQGSRGFDPLVEAQQECLDIALYSMLLYYRLERLKEKLDGVASKES